MGGGGVELFDAPSVVDVRNRPDNSSCMDIIHLHNYTWALHRHAVRHRHGHDMTVVTGNARLLYRGFSLNYLQISNIQTLLAFSCTSV